MIRIFTLYILLALAGVQATGQDPVFSQYFANPLYMTPALAGTAGESRINFNHRNQWPEINNAYVTSAVSYDAFLKKYSSGLGVTLMNDMVANNAISTTSLSLNYAYHLKLNRNIYLSTGVRSALVQRSVNWSKLTWNDMIDDSRGFIYQTSQPTATPGYYFDMSSGMSLFSNKWYIGGTIDHLTNPNESLLNYHTTLPRKFTAFGSYLFQINPSGLVDDVIDIRSTIIYSKQAELQQITAGFHATIESLTFGLMHRLNRSMIFLAGFKVGDVRLGYSYDLPVQRKLLGATFGAHEISCQIQLKRKPIRQSRPMFPLDCPTF